MVAATFATLLFVAVWFGITGHLPWNSVEAPEPRPGSFRVETVPADAVVALLNGGAPYEPGVRLQPGRYEVEVSAPGYATKREFIEHGTADTVRRIELRDYESPTPAQEPKRDLEPNSKSSRSSESLEIPEPRPRSFRVETVPAGAVVALLNGGPLYEPGMRLEPGRYEVEVSAPGYATKREVVEHGTVDTVWRIELREQESLAPVPELPPKPKRDSEPQSRPSRPSEWTNSVGMRFVRIPAGEFQMGSHSNLALPHEQPVTQVQIRSAFWMGKYEVTQQQWRAVMGTNPSRFRNCGPDCPVESVSWVDVQGFVRRLNAMAGSARYRLPTEAEWEYAARAGTSTDTPAGNLQIQGVSNAPLLDGIAWYGAGSTIPERWIAGTGRRSSTGRAFADRIQSGRRIPTLSACMTCWGTYGSGCEIVMGRTRAHR